MRPAGTPSWWPKNGMEERAWRDWPARCYRWPMTPAERMDERRCAYVPKGGMKGLIASLRTVRPKRLPKLNGR